MTAKRNRLGGITQAVSAELRWRSFRAASLADGTDETPSRKRLWLRAIGSVKGQRQHFLLVVGAIFLGPDGTGYASAAAVADFLGWGQSTVRRYFAWACDEGWLVRTSRGHRRWDGRRVASEYQMSLPLTYVSGREAQPLTYARAVEAHNRSNGATQPLKWGHSTAHLGEHPTVISNSKSNIHSGADVDYAQAPTHDMTMTNMRGHRPSAWIEEEEVDERGYLRVRRVPVAEDPWD